jgi:hypothetical protein
MAEALLLAKDRSVASKLPSQLTEEAIAPPGREGWREEPGWWFKHCAELIPIQTQLDTKCHSGKQKPVLTAKSFFVLRRYF